tara:strand:- start:1872 stop:2039 length:168 start_codon:yes stop_codon:yes gene_type:complete
MGAYTVDPSLAIALYETVVGTEMKEIKSKEGDEIKKVPSCDDLKKIAININMVKE